MVLKRGDNNEIVKKVQIVLGVDPVGNFGPKTEEAVKEWQKKNGPRMIPQTRAVLCFLDDPMGHRVHSLTSCNRSRLLLELELLHNRNLHRHRKLHRRKPKQQELL